MKVARVLAAPLALVAAFLLINWHYGYWPTMSVLLGRPVPGQVSAPRFDQAIGSRPGSNRSVETDIKAWLPRSGLYGPIVIPATPVGFAARTTWVWLPPRTFVRPAASSPCW